MSDGQARIQILCESKFKRRTKKAIAEKEIDQVMDGYFKVFKIGLSLVEKMSQEEFDNYGK